MTWVFAIVGGVLGLVVAANSSQLLGPVVGVVLGILVAQYVRLLRRVDELEEAARQPRSDTRTGISPPPIRPAAPSPAPPVPAGGQAPTVARPPAPAAAAPVPSHSLAQPSPRIPSPPPENRLDVAFRLVRQWLTTGNVPVKIGVIVSFFGVAFLLKYAVDRRLFAFPIELRLLLVAAAAVVLLIVGWRLRARARTYALSVQGAGLGILYMTTFAAYRLYGLIPSPFAFVLLVVLTVAGGALAVLQDARGLALFGVVGGFLAPILASSGSGNHVVLFSYYLVLNAMILGVAWFRPWRELNLVGFAFTFVIGGLWAWESYRPEFYASTQPFIILHFLFYQGVAILFARRQAPRLRDIVDGTLVFATPVLAFAMQAEMLRDSEFGLAYSALAAALFYAVIATLLSRDESGRMRLLVEAYLALAVGFATLAIPLALDARWTAASWALEGAALAWVGQRQGRTLARAAGILLVFGAGLSFTDHGWRAHEGPPLLNGNVLGGALIALSAFFVARRLERSSSRWQAAETIAARALVAWGVIWWIGTGSFEIGERLLAQHQAAAYVAFVPLSALLMSFVAKRLIWPAGAAATYVTLPWLALSLLSTLFGSSHPLARWGLAAWPLAIAAQFWLLRRHDAGFPALAPTAHFAASLLIALVGICEAYWQVDRVTYGLAWPASAASLVPGLMWLLVARLAARRAWPVATFHRAYLLGVAPALLALQWLLVGAINLGGDGNASPLPYIPLFNPADLAGLFALLCAWHWLRLSGIADRRSLYILAGTAFALATFALLRATHHLADVPWQLEAMMASVRVQAALSIFWGSIAFAAMVLGTRRGRRAVWISGAGLMGVVVAKLFVVELGGRGTVERIVSFIAVGALLLVVGYLAPAPPRQLEQADA
jgi:uncharacterized membrane protein